MTNPFEIPVEKAGFSCLRCGACCSGSGNEVSVSPPEIDRICRISGLFREEIAEPYPVWLDFPDGRKYTFGWVLKRGEDTNCIFLRDGQCLIYEYRPHLCRTYPFMPDGDKLLISECPGTGTVERTEQASVIAADIIQRQNAEEEEFEGTKAQYQKHCNTSAPNVVFDSEGCHPLGTDIK
jgi:Fe-S-cluster containining protein